MKVLFCTPYTRFDCGIAQWARHLIAYYEKNDTTVQWDLISLDRKTDYVESMGSIYRVYKGILEYYPVIRELCKKIRRGNYDVVHICTSAGFGIFACLLMLKIAKFYGAATILHFHFGRIPLLMKSGNWEAKMCLKVCKEATVSVPIDMASYTALLNNGIDNAVYLPNPMSQEVNEVITENPAIKRIPKRLLFVGHMFAAKGVFELVSAVKQIPDVTLRMVGAYEKPIKVKLDLLIAGDSNRIEIVGAISHKDVVKEMMACDIFVLPTYSEGFPGVVLEAMGCGCPIIASAVGAIPQMLANDEKGVYGILIKPKDVDGLVSAIMKMVSDNTLKEQCGVNVQERVNKLYSIEVVWKQLVDVWEKAKNMKHKKNHKN